VARLRVQSRVREAAGRALLSQLHSGAGVRADLDEKMLAGARSFADTEGLHNVDLVKDDLFSSRLAPGSFGLVHARFQIAPLGRADEQIAAYCRLLKRGGWLVLEDPDISSWREGFRKAGGNINSGRELPAYLRKVGMEPQVSAHVVAFPFGRPYLRLPLRFAASLRPRLEAIIGDDAFNSLVREAGAELDRPGTWGTTTTLIQACARLPVTSNKSVVARFLFCRVCGVWRKLWYTL
jgi:SAM-dependent methyltransferase